MTSKQVQVKAKPNASLRTKNRIKEHGPILLFFKISNQTDFDPGINYHGFSTVKGEWWGWLKSDEIEVTEIEEQE